MAVDEVHVFCSEDDLYCHLVEFKLRFHASCGLFARTELKLLFSCHKYNIKLHLFIFNYTTGSIICPGF